MQPTTTATTTTARIKPSLFPLRYLGGLNPPPPFAVMMMTNPDLPRPTKLLPPPFTLQTKDKAVRTAYMKIWDGNFVATWWVDTAAAEGDRLIVSGGPAPPANDDDAADDEGYCLPAELCGPLIQVVLNYSTKTILEEQVICHNYHDFETAMKKEKIKTALCHRMMHHVVRTNGYRLPGDGAYVACQALITLYTGGRNWQGLKKCYDSALDAAIIAADLAICMEINHIQEILHSLNTVAEHLEAVEKYSLAAKVYIQAAENYSQSGFFFEDRLTLYCNAGLAYKRNSELLDAEDCYIRALGVSLDHGLDLNHDTTTDIITNLVILYNEENRKLPLVEAQQDKVIHGFLALLSAAGFKAARGGTSHELVFNVGSILARVCLPSQYQAQQGAKGVLTMATTIRLETTTTTTCNNNNNSMQQKRLQHFRSVISACMPVILPFSIHHKNNNLEANRVDVEAARQVVDLVCSNPVCTTISSSSRSDMIFQSCPCKSAFYCQKNCQVAHWPTHKLSCPQRKIQQEKKKKQQQAAATNK